MSSKRLDDESTRQTNLPTPTPGNPDEQSTKAVDSVGIVAELRAAFQNGERKTLPLYAMPDQIVVGRGSASDWQLDDPSLSRKHCQFRWNGRELTVEDLGSANGTRVGARPARNPTPVHAGDTVQLGTVIVTLESRVEHEPLAHSADEQATRLVSSPAPSPMDIGGTGSSSLPPLTAQPTVVRAPLPRPEVTAPGALNPRAAVFRPEHDAARPDEPTRPWDPQRALHHAPEKAIDASELMERLKAAWKTNRRPFVMAFAALWIVILLVVWQLMQPKPPEEDSFAQLPPKKANVKIDKGSSTSPRESDVKVDKGSEAKPDDKAASPMSDDEREQALSDAVAAYDQGRMNDALAIFRRLASDPKDTGAKFMVDLIESRGGGQ